MKETFVSEIKIVGLQRVPTLNNFDIKLSKNERKHLIITGKNGSGKTTLLELIAFLISVAAYRVKNIGGNCASSRTKDPVDLCFSVPLEQVAERFSTGALVLCHFRSKRVSPFMKPEGVKKIEFSKEYRIENEKIGKHFIQHLVNLQADKSFANDAGEIEESKRIEKWFKKLEMRLSNIFQAPDLKLRFDRKAYDFSIIEKDKEYSFNTLPDGFSALLNVVAELILQMEAYGVRAFDMEGIVLIDEVETHLHIELQKKILPFLTDFFPKIQFIVTTHSPFVITSLPNAVVCDLERRIVIDEDLSGYSYQAIVESYYDSDQYSQRLKERLARFEQLAFQNGTKGEQEQAEFIELQRYFDSVPKALSPELEVKLQQIKLSQLAIKSAA